MTRRNDPSALFQFVEAPTVIHYQNPMERQRAEDGSQHTIPGRMCAFPREPELYLEGVSKAQEVAPAAPQEEQLDPSAVVKSFLGR